MDKVWLLLWGVVARCINAVVPVKKRLWIFGSDLGNMYREGSKYLFEYMVKNCPEYECKFVTRSKSVYSELVGRGLPCVMNLSVAGVWASSRAECVFTTQLASDIVFLFKKRARRFFYLVHGQPYKIALVELARTTYGRKIESVDARSRNKLLTAIKSRLSSWFVCDYGCLDSEFVSATSDFLSRFQKRDFGEDMPSVVLGMPRNDALFQPDRMVREKWIDGIKGKFVVSYMPTHRLYGRGAFSPTPFANRPDVQKWMEENNVVLVVKNHPTMLLYKTDERPYESASIRDITTAMIDPMTVLYHSDVLITDYSSVWMDYLLLSRPIVFYSYDNFIHDDVGVYYDVKEEHVGHFCYSEDELFSLIRSIKVNYDGMRPADDVVRKFHKYVDGNSCERYFKEISKADSLNVVKCEKER